MNLSGADTLNCIYFILFGIGLGYAIIAVLLGQISHIDLPHGVDVDLPGVDLHPGGPDLHLDVGGAHDIAHDVDHPQVGLSPLSPITIATFITTFGGVGFLLNNFTSISPLLGGVIAAVSGVVLSGAMFLFYTRVLMAAQGSSEVLTGDYIGKTGEITAPIPEGRVGEVALVVRGSRVAMTARSADGSAIPRGALVTVVDVVGGMLVVKPRENV